MTLRPAPAARPGPVRPDLLVVPALAGLRVLAALTAPSGLPGLPGRS
ncbi:hypothetical protein [Kitasatospora indigofera]